MSTPPTRTGRIDATPAGCPQPSLTSPGAQPPDATRVFTHVASSHLSSFNLTVIRPLHAPKPRRFSEAVDETPVKTPAKAKKGKAAAKKTPAKAAAKKTPAKAAAAKTPAKSTSKVAAKGKAGKKAGKKAAATKVTAAAAAAAAAAAVATTAAATATPAGTKKTKKKPTKKAAAAEAAAAAEMAAAEPVDDAEARPVLAAFEPVDETEARPVLYPPGLPNAAKPAGVRLLVPARTAARTCVARCTPEGREGREGKGR